MKATPYEPYPKKIKVIDLLNKIANGEELPEKIKIWGGYYYLCENDNSGQCYFTEKEGFGGFPLKFNTSQMNDKVEIIEEAKKIEKLSTDDELVDEKAVLNNIGLQRNLIKLTNKINEIIDEINKMKEGK